jgi:hypothetical protein
MYLRKAEIENCIGHHNRECCTVPLAGGGVHQVRQPAEMAAATFTRLLELTPEDLRAKWLLNIAAMALGNYPEGVPEAHRIPPERFRSEADIKRFVNVAEEAGVRVFNLAGGSILDDFDGDGLLDLVTSTADLKTGVALFHNEGNGHFEDRSTASGLADQLAAFNCVSGDYDNDGRLDLLLLRGGWMFSDGEIRHSLVHNNGDGTFTDVTRAAGMGVPAYPTQTGAWADFDNDGDLDIYIGGESRAPGGYANEDYPNQLYLNNGDGTFRNIAEAARVTNDRYCKGVAAGDYDNDGDQDIYVSNIKENRLYRNNGDLTFVDVAAEAGVEEPVGRSFATWFFDYNNDGWLDIWVGAFDAELEDVAADYFGRPYDASHPCLYRNNRDGTFTNVAGEMGLGHAWMPMGANYGDLDNDGWLDICLATGNPNFQTLVPNVMLRNDAAKRFQDVTTSGGFGNLQKGHGVSFGDVDNDGDQDIYQQLGGMLMADKFYSALFKNPGHGNHHLFVKCIGTKSNRIAYGARLTVVVQTPRGKREIHRAVGAVSSFGGSPARQEIGLGDATSIVRVDVWWPRSNIRSSYENVSLDTQIEITEGEAEPKVVPLTAFLLPT